MKTSYLLLCLCLTASFIAAKVTGPGKPSSSEAPLKMAEVYTTAEGTDLRLTHTDSRLFHQGDQPLETEITVFVSPHKTFQHFIGIGGAATDAAAEVFAGLPPDQQQEFLTAYFDRGKGIGYTVLRTNIHSCDFSSSSYTYVTGSDKDLKTFSIEHDLNYRIPFIQRILKTTGGKMILYASPWSPPDFMKTNGSMLHGGSLLAEYEDAWALYFTRFIKAYEQAGIPIWGITIQNEPMATQTWESCIYTAEEERDFLKNHLGPRMVKEGLGDKKILVWDHNRDLISHRVNVIMSDPEAAKYAWGIGFHWYEDWSGGDPMYENVEQVHADFPDKHLIFTEGCNDRFDSTQLQSWSHAEHYASSMIHDFNAGTEAWTDWNLLLDQNGGPNHVGNFCFAPVHADTRTGQLIFTPAYFYIGHFSKFIQPDAVRVSSVSSRSILKTTSFLNPDGRLVTIILNTSAKAVDYKLYADVKAVDLTIPPRAIQTILYEDR